MQRIKSLNVNSTGTKYVNVTKCFANKQGYIQYIALETEECWINENIVEVLASKLIQTFIQ